MKTVGNLKDSVSGILQGTNLNNVTNLNIAIERSARTLCQQADIPEASGKFNITLYDGVIDYLAPTNIFGTAEVDLRPQGISRPSWAYVYKLPVQEFDRNKSIPTNGYDTTFEFYQGTPIIRIQQSAARAKILIDSMAETTGWTNGGSAGTIYQNQTNFYQSPASLRFNLTGASTGYIEKTLSNSIDLSEYQGIGVVFLAIYTPSGTNLTSVSLRIGSSPSAYTTVSNTQTNLGSFTSNNWTLVPFDLSTGSDTGTPNYSSISYVRLSVTSAATLTNFGMGYLFTALPSPHQLLYQSNAIFMPSGSNPSTTITDDNDYIILNEAAYLIFEYESAMTIALQNGGTLQSGVVQMIDDKLHNPDKGLYVLYRSDNPSQEIRTTGNWYNQ